MYSYSDAPDLNKSIIDRANADIVAYHKGRKSVDDTFVVSVFEAQARVELEMKKMANPGINVNWPEHNPVCGFIYERGY